MTNASQSVTSRISKASASAITFSKQPRIKALIDEIVFETDERAEQLILAARRLSELRQEFEVRRKQLKMTCDLLPESALDLR